MSSVLPPVDSLTIEEAQAALAEGQQLWFLIIWQEGYSGQYGWTVRDVVRVEHPIHSPDGVFMVKVVYRSKASSTELCYYTVSRPKLENKSFMLVDIVKMTAMRLAGVDVRVM